MAEANDSPPPPTTVLGLAQEHIGLVLTLIPVVLSILRVFAVANGDRATLVTLLTTLDVTAVLLGTFAWALPTAVGVVAAILWIRWLQPRPSSGAPEAANRATSLWPTVLATLVALILFALAPVNDLVNLLLCVAAVFVFRKPERNRLGRALMIGAGFLVFVLGPVVFRGANMWLPAERIEVKEQPTLVAYVLAADRLHVTVLRADTSTAQILRLDDIESRTICRVNPGVESTSLVSYLTGSASGRTPAC